MRDFWWLGYLCWFPLRSHHDRHPACWGGKRPSFANWLVSRCEFLDLWIDAWSQPLRRGQRLMEGATKFIQMNAPSHRHIQITCKGHDIVSDTLSICSWVCFHKNSDLGWRTTLKIFTTTLEPEQAWCQPLAMDPQAIISRSWIFPAKLVSRGLLIHM